MVSHNPINIKEVNYETFYSSVVIYSIEISFCTGYLQTTMRKSLERIIPSD